MNEVVTHGGGEALYYILNGVAMITHGDTYADLTALSVAFAAGWIAFKAAFGTTNIRETSLWFGGFLLFYQALLVPKTTVMISDRFDPSYTKSVDNVPYGLAFFASSTSAIGNGIAELFDQSFALPGDLSYSDSGMLMGSKVFRDVQKSEVMDVEFASNLNSFIENCVLTINYVTGGITNTELSKSQDLWSLITVDNTLTTAAGIEYQDGDDQSYQSCKDAAFLLEAKWDTEISDQTIYHYEKLFHKSADDQTDTILLGNLISDANNFFINASDDSADIIRQSLMINAIQNASINMSEYADVISAIETRNSFERAASQATTWLPLARSAIEAMLYGIFPFVFLLFLLPVGVKVFTNYIQALIWLQAWPPLYAVLHLIMTLYNQQDLIPYHDKGVTIQNLNSIEQVQEDLSLIAGYLMLMIPFLATKLLNGFAGIGHMLGSMTGALQGASATAVSEMTRGNYSQGNVSQNNVSGNKLDTRFSSLTHGSTQDTDYGGQVTQFLGGKTVMKMGGASDEHHTKMNQSMSEKQILAERADYSQKMGNNYDNMAQKALNQSFSSSLEFANRLESAEQNGESWTQNIDDQTRESVSNLKQYAEDNNVNIGLGGGVLVKGGTEFNVSSHDQKALSEDFETIQRFSSESSSSIQNSEAQSQLEATTSSYDKFQSNSQTASKYYGVEESINKYSESVKEEGFDVSVDRTSDFTQNFLRDRGYDDKDVYNIMDDSRYANEQEQLIQEYRFNLGNQMLSEKGIDVIDQTKSELGVAEQSFSEPNVDFSDNHREELKAKFTPNKLANTDIQHQVAQAHTESQAHISKGEEVIDKKSEDKVGNLKALATNETQEFLAKHQKIDPSTGKLKNTGENDE
ncbi:MAG: hypothetical protein HON23_05345 [Rickettsiales bacterium]|nr:hypothetical protein [Rickettsiales bacterium]